VVSPASLLAEIARPLLPHLENGSMIAPLSWTDLRPRELTSQAPGCPA
jgi:hypothetical protein